MNAASSAVVLVTDLFPPATGGSAELLFNVYARLRQTRVTVLTANADGLTDPLPGLTVLRRRLSEGHWGIVHPRGLFNHARRTADVIRQTWGREAVVHCGRALPEGLAALVARSLGGPPYVCWLHGEELGYAAASRELSALMRRVYRGAAAIVANSRNSAGELRAFGVANDRVVVVHPGVDAGRFRPDLPEAARIRARVAPGGETVLLTVGRLQRRKGHDQVIEALPRLGKDRPVRYVVAGNGEERPRLEQLARRLGVEDRVMFVGKVPADELPAYYAAADIFVHPNRLENRDFEGFGIVFLEAAAAGLPVVAGRSGGVPEAVADGVTGALVSGVDVDELARALARLIDDPSHRHALGRAGRARVLKDFGWDRAAAAVQELHEAILAGRS